MEVIVQDANNIVIEVDQGRQGRGVEDVSLITVGADYYLLFTFTDGTTDQVGPIATTVTEVISAEVRNAEAVTILKGQPVYLFQAQGNLATVKLAYNTSDATSAKTLGLAAENIAPNAQGLITCQGTLGGLNTSAYNEGDTLYLGATAGTLTNVKPQAPNHLVYIGVVERANAGAGQIYVRVQNGFELDEIHDVQINSPVNGNTLIYDASTSLWKNAGITAGSGISVTNGASSITVGNTGVLSFSGGTTGLTPATATTGAVSLAGTLSTANGGTGLSSFTANGVVYASSTSALTTGSALTFDGVGTINQNASSGNAVFNLQGASTNNAVFRLRNVTTGALAGIFANNSKDLVFEANGAVEQMRLTSTGLGIGTSSPGARLDVSGTVAGVLAAQIVNLSSSSSAIARLRLDSLGGAWLIDNNRVDGSLTIGNGSERLRIGSTGNLLVGTTTNTNSSLLTVNGTISETVSSVQYLVASQFDVGTAPNKIPLNQYLGNLAYQNASAIAGQAGFSAGTAALPSIASATDLTTGRWFPSSGVMAWSTGGVERMRLDASGNLGLGVTPSAGWTSANSQRAAQIGPVGSISSLDGGASNRQFSISNNAINFNATPTYFVSDFATSYRTAAGQHQWLTAPSGTAGNAISFTQAMTLDASGNLGVGTTTPFTRFDSASARTTALSSIASFNTMPVSVTDTTAFAQGVGGGINFRAQLSVSNYSTYASIWSFRESATTVDYRGSLLFGTAENGLGYPLERMRITSTGNQVLYQPAESAQNTSVTLTVANLQARVITSNAAVTLTLPTGASLDTYVGGMAVDSAFECTFIATTANAITIAANGNTTVGSLTVAGNTSGTFRFRKTAANTFTVYRVA